MSFEVLHEFERPGAQPLAPLLLHSNGNFYGTSVGGGACGHGSVFRLNPSGELSTLISFTGSSGPVPGSGPIGSLAEGAGGDLFGTTSSAGTSGFGLAFKLTTTGSYTPLVEFTGQTGVARGSVPGSLVAHPDGTFYGTTAAGGANEFGTVFRLSATGVITTLLEFSGTGGLRPGSQPVGPLALSGSTLFGITREGGPLNQGTAYELTTSGTYRQLATFDGSNGALPSALTLHSNGSLYGTCEFGGNADFGTTYSLTSGAVPVLNVLHHFDDLQGSQPLGHLTELASGALAGTASLGGAEGLGVLFEIATNGAFAVRGTFTGESGGLPGAEPLAGLTSDSTGRLFGLTSAGGPANLGTAFRLDPGGSAQPVADFSLPAGWFPSGAPHSDADGFFFPVAIGGAAGEGAILHLVPGGPAPIAVPTGGPLGSEPTGGLLEVGPEFFGVASRGGDLGRGAAFRFQPGSGIFLTKTFSNPLGARAEGPLVLGGDGALYGVAREGGSTGQGTVYRLTTAGELTRLVSFTGNGGSAPGRIPRGPLARAPSGNFYGLTEQGGAAGAGVIFKVTPAGVYSAVHEFSASEPRTPRGGLVPGADGFLYGTTSLGGAQNAGAVLRIDPADDSWSEVASLTESTGREPAGALALGPEGDLYGMTTAGGPAGHGGIFRFSPTNGGALEALILFTGESGPAPGRGQAVDGPDRYLGGLTSSPAGILSGVAPAGGARGGGVAFRLTLSRPIEEWKLANLGDREAADTADPDLDGLSTVLEYGLHLLPQLPDSGNVPGTEVRSYPDGNRLSLVLPRDPARFDITVRIEASSNLQAPWDLLALSTGGRPFTGPGLVAGDSDTPGLKMVEIRDIERFDAHSRRFLRIGVTRN